MRQNTEGLAWTHFFVFPSAFARVCEMDENYNNHLLKNKIKTFCGFLWGIVGKYVTLRRCLFDKPISCSF